MEVSMKKLIATVLLLLLFIPAASAYAPAIDGLSVAELLALRAAIDLRLTELGYDPYADLDSRLSDLGYSPAQRGEIIKALGSNGETQQSIAPAKQEVYVWIPKSGKKYHSTDTCSNMKNPARVTLDAAKTAGYGPCSKCNPPR